MPQGAAAAGLASVQIGKVGLALSGGGFRASLFHIGVLARLAELDVLRHVEVLSCVSGGSILGAAYYLTLRARLEDTADGKMTRADYVAVVEELARSFREGVGQNLRGHLFTSPVADAKMLALPGYNRTVHAGELYEKLFYRPILETRARRRRFGLLRPRPCLRMRDMGVDPAGEIDDFRPQEQNWRRRDKVPVLIINAATLNTGHAWQFTASWMGEPPSWSGDDVDRNLRLRRIYYHQAPGRHRNLALGTAVAASAAVPGIFPPVTLRRLYPEITVRLADGGVHDNQGIAGLVNQDCSVMIVSDASGQMNELAKPPELAYPVLKRAMSAQSARVRTTQWHDLRSRNRGGALRGLMFLHLRSGLGGQARDWIGCDDPQEDEIREPPGDGPTDYGMRRDMQGALARLRTDLDAFSPEEADALMTSGYRMATHEFPQCLPDMPIAADPSPSAWDFLRDFDERMATPQTAGRTLRVLEVGAGRLFRRAKLTTSR
jgi:predicted acylesterase/phospholipase RssA